VLTCASSETALGLAGLLAAASLAAVNPGGGIATGVAIGLAVQAIAYLTAPLVALAADRSLARAAGNLLEIPAVAIAPTSTSQPIQSRAREQVGHDPRSLAPELRQVKQIAE
jgi:hypothetical protein